MWWRQNKWKIIVPVLIAAVLAAAWLTAPETGEDVLQGTAVP